VELYPAIDLIGGRAVRLEQGRFEDETVYRDDPVEVAVEFADAGARWLHVVDLDAARWGTSEQTAVVAAICAAVGIPVQCGGGVRDLDRAAALLDAGVRRVVIGTAAIEQPELLGRAAARWPDRVAAGLDHRGGEVRVRGWQEGSGRDVLDLASILAGEGAAALIVTDIGRDGMLAGPDLAGLSRALDAAAGVPVIASGGVAGASDLIALAALRSPEGRALDGAIVGKAIYEGRIGVAQAVAACRGVPA
jgi:phosphoribosylformimino-5-aminoimidazole carboxamide ribotide isomerase